MAFAKKLVLIPPENTPEGLVGRDGRGPFRLDAEAVARRTIAARAAILLDFNHALECDDPAGAVHAGYVIGLGAREDGALVGDVRLTEEGYRAICAGEYKYISPVFSSFNGEITVLRGAALTNNPALYHTAIDIVVTQSGGTMEPKDDKRDPFEHRICEAFGISVSDYRRAAQRADKGEREVDRSWKPEPKRSRVDGLFARK